MRGQRFINATDGAAEIVGLVLMVGLTVLLATTVSVTVTDFATNGQVKPPVQAGADIDASDTDNRVTVTWVANANAHALHVRFERNDAKTSTIRLRQVGDAVTIDAHGLSLTGSKQWEDSSLRLANGDHVAITVTAERGGQRTVIAQTTVAV